DNIQLLKTHGAALSAATRDDEASPPARLQRGRFAPRADPVPAEHMVRLKPRECVALSGCPPPTTGPVPHAPPLPSRDRGGAGGGRRHAAPALEEAAHGGPERPECRPVEDHD